MNSRPTPIKEAAFEARGPLRAADLERTNRLRTEEARLSSPLRATRAPSVVESTVFVCEVVMDIRDAACQERLKIGKAASVSGMTAPGLRYYERRGLIKPLRSASGYRLYRPEELARLQRIRWARNLGFSLREIAAIILLAGDRGHEQSSDLVRIRARKKVVEIEEKIGQLHAARRALRALAACECRGDCPILDAASRPRKPRRTGLTSPSDRR
jgi:MerR family transcriptional regulator, copper efflux regulator